MKSCRWFAVLLLLLVNTSLQAADVKAVTNEPGNFTHHRSNYVIWRTDSVTDDSNHLEFQFSTKYLMSNNPFGFEDLEFYLAYTGKFDFFFNSRDSSPVINRLSNPEFILRMNDARYTRGGYYQLVLGHESNGQAINSQQAYDSYTEPYVQDFVSRGWDYLAFEGVWNVGSPPRDTLCRESFKCTRVNLTARSFMEDGVFQGEIEDTLFKNSNAEQGIEKYDGLRLSAHWEGIVDNSKTFSEAGVSLSYKTGIGKPFHHGSVVLEARASVKILNGTYPLYLRYHNGYLEEISDYTERTDYLAFGLLFRQGE